MEKFDKVSIDELSKRDLLLIIKSLEYTYENTNLEEFISLRNNIIRELCFLTNTNEENFLNYLETGN